MGTHHPTPTPERDGAVWLAGEASGDFIASLVLPETMRRMEGVPLQSRSRSARISAKTASF